MNLNKIPQNFPPFGIKKQRDLLIYVFPLYTVSKWQKSFRNCQILGNTKSFRFTSELNRVE